MSRLDVQFLDESFHRVLFDSMPMPVFVVDRDVSILDYNSAAARIIGQGRREILGRRGGDILHCIHAPPKGCGNSVICRNCIVRQSVRAAFRGQHVDRKWARMELFDNKHGTLDLRVTCHPFKYKRHEFALLLLEGLEEKAVS